jgi:transaldolase
MIDPMLDTIGTPEAHDLRGKAAVANARLAYQEFEETFSGSRWEALAAAGAWRQRSLWASTGVKNTAYPDTLYVTELVAPNTVNTMPEATLLAVADHGVVRGDTIRATYADSAAVIAALIAVGIDVTEVTAKLEAEGVDKFEVAWVQLLASVEAAIETARA